MVQFSVVVAAYNQSVRILPTLRSVFDQTHGDYEVIVVGDGCTDDTGAVIAAHFGEKVRWQNLEQNHGSQSGPNNEGNRLATGTHIAYLGHDDIWSPHHLSALAELIASTDPDFAVSGTLYHTPDGTDFSALTGFFDDSSVALKEFFPPSSFAHRKGLLDEIGPWPNSKTATLPVDVDLLLRAAKAGCRFVSTNRLTVHKFAAGHRYLSYLFPSSAEQEAMLEKMGEPDFAERVLTQVLRRIAAGARLHRMDYPDSLQAAAGHHYKHARKLKGLVTPRLSTIGGRTFLPLSLAPAALDWDKPKLGETQLVAIASGQARCPVRWSGQNPNPNYFLSVRISRPFELRVYLAALTREFRLLINGSDTPFRVENSATGAIVLVARPELPLPVEQGLRIIFQSFPPGTHLPRRASIGRWIALAGFEIVPDV